MSREPGIHSDLDTPSLLYRKPLLSRIRSTRTILSLLISKDRAIENQVIIQDRSHILQWRQVKKAVELHLNDIQRFHALTQ